MDHSTQPPSNDGGGLLQYGSSAGEAEEADIENFPKRQKSIANNKVSFTKNNYEYLTKAKDKKFCKAMYKLLTDK